MDADDYFGDDDLIIDDTLLAVLDQAENKYKAEAQRHTQQLSVGERRPADVPPSDELPPLKKQKTSHEWDEDPEIVVNPEDDEGLPEISIFGGSSYRFPGAQRAATSALAAQLRGPQEGAGGQNRRRPSSPVRNATHVVADPIPSMPVATTSVLKPPESANRAIPAPPPGQPPGQPDKPSSTVKPRRTSTFSSVQAALAALVPPPSNSSANARIVRPASVASSRAAQSSIPSRLSPAPSIFASQSRTSVSARPPALGTSHLSRPTIPPPSAVASTTPRLSGPVVPLRHVAQSVPLHPRLPSPPPPPPLLRRRDDRNCSSEVEALRAQLEELLRAQEEKDKALEEAQNARYAKEGEVSILRKNMEKTAKEHAAEVARIKAEKERAEAAQVQLQKEKHEELERLRTQWVFKQHELETSVRKTPWSVRTKRIDNQGPPTPVSSSHQRRQAAADGLTGSAINVLQTPSRPRIDKSLPSSPSYRLRRKVVDSSPPQNAVKLPGFHNAFEPSPLKTGLQLSQVSQSTQVRGKGKERASDKASFDADFPAEELFFNPTPRAHDVHMQSSPLSSPREETREEPFNDHSTVQESSHVEARNSPRPEDVEMNDDSKMAQLQNALEPLQVSDWTKELHRIVLTHKHHGSKHPTLQLLMNLTTSSSDYSDRMQEYSAQSASLLESLGTATLGVSDTDDVIRSIQHILSTMGRILCDIGSIAPLAALLDLMKTIAVFIPSFVSLALAPNDEHGGDEPPEILLLLCETVRDHLASKDGSSSEGCSALASEVLGLLEAVCWYTPPDLAMRLSVFVRKAGVLSTLVNATQPTWLLQRALCAMALLASYHSLWRHFLSFPLPEMPEVDSAAKDYTSIPHIEQLASLLIDATRDGLESRRLREAILNFFTTLAVSHTDALSILLQSRTLLPSIIVFLSNLTAPLWEEDEDVMVDSELITWTVQMTTRTVVLLHYLMTNADSSKVNFRQKLMFPPKRFGNALWHMFTVSLGRISYAFPPDWAGMENAMKLDQICDLAKDVLELAVDGPELESIWAAFHVDENMPVSKTQFEEDESEARRGDLHPPD
ncbi:hypothetical protein BD414DRAFT_576645 [Trametes punicea]|nr:hypothetical protein BD414DRAFT_576645 [Trametes punicea]